MKFAAIAAFEVVHESLPWPWIAFDPSGTRFAFAGSNDRIHTRVLEEGAVLEGSSFPLPADLRVPSLRGFSLDAAGLHVAVLASAASESVLSTVDENGEQRRSSISSLVGPGFTARALAFERSGERVWISAESDAETALLFVDVKSHAVLGVTRSAGLPPPATHELYVHPQDDAVLLLAACGQDGTFARIAGWSGEGVEAIETALDGGSIAAGYVGFSLDGQRVHLVEADELRTHAWPTLHELSSVPLPDDIVSSYAGAVLGQHIYVDGQEADSGADAVMRFDRAAIRGSVLRPPFPSGMWAGRLGPDAIVSVEAKGDPAKGTVLCIALPDTSN